MVKMFCRLHTLRVFFRYEQSIKGVGTRSFTYILHSWSHFKGCNGYEFVLKVILVTFRNCFDNKVLLILVSMDVIQFAKEVLKSE